MAKSSTHADGTVIAVLVAMRVGLWIAGLICIAGAVMFAVWLEDKVQTSGMSHYEFAVAWLRWATWKIGLHS